MPYKFTPEAGNDLKDIYVYGFLNFGETQAETYVADLEKAFESLSHAPLICRERTEFTPPVRIHHPDRSNFSRQHGDHPAFICAGGMKSLK